jgi:hypothetical protein
MIISTVVNDINNDLILKSQHKDYVSSTGTFFYGGKLITADELPKEKYISSVKHAHRKKQKKIVSSFLKKHLEAELGEETKRYVDHEMNQWLNSKEDVLTHFKAFGREVPACLIEALKTETVVFPDDLVFE